MHRIALLFFAASLYGSIAASQNNVDFLTIDSKINLHYSVRNWDSVIYYGKLGVANNIDYFNLRKYTGEAYYYKQNYAKAAEEFVKANSFNSADEQTQELLYYSYLFSGQEGDARLYGAGMTDVAKENVGLKKNFSVNNLYFESGPILSNNLIKNNNISNSWEKDSSRKIDLTGNIFYAHGGLELNITKRVSIYAGVSYVNDEKQSIFKLSEHKPAGRIFTEKDTVIFHPMPPPGVTTHDTIIENIQQISLLDTSYKFKHNVRQTEYYIKCNFHVAKGLDITPFFHLLSSRSTTFSFQNNPQNFIAYDTIARHTQFYYTPMMWVDTVFYTYLSNLAPIDHYEIIQRDTSAYNYSLGLSIQKNWGMYSMSLFGSVSNLNGLKQREAGASLTWYPKGNLNLYFTSTLTNFGEQNRKAIVFNQLAGCKIHNNLWLEGFATLGNINNFTENNGFIVNNNPDIIKFRCGLTPIFVFKRFDFSIHYQYQSKEGVLGVTELHQGNGNGNQHNSINTQYYNFQNHLIIGSIKWKLLKQKSARSASFL
jgi:hypothetical protein